MVLKIVSIASFVMEFSYISLKRIDIEKFSFNMLTMEPLINIFSTAIDLIFLSFHQFEFWLQRTTTYTPKSHRRDVTQMKRKICKRSMMFSLSGNMPSITDALYSSFL